MGILGPHLEAIGRDFPNFTPLYFTITCTAGLAPIVTDGGVYAFTQAVIVDSGPGWIRFVSREGDPYTKTWNQIIRIEKEDS